MTRLGQNFDMYQGDTRILEVTVLNVNNQPINISNVDINWVAYKQTGKTIVLNKTVGSGIEIVVPASGRFNVNINPPETLDLLGLYLHECELKDVGGHVVTIFTGKMDVFESLASNT